MNSGELSLLETGVWIIPLFLVGTVALLYVLVRSWQNQTQQDLKSIQTELRSFHTALKQLQLATQQYSIEDREPFGSEVKVLIGKIDAVSNRVNSLQQQYAGVRGNVNRLSVNRWQTLLGSPFFWFQWWNIRKQVSEIRNEIRNVQSAFAASQSTAKNLLRRGWEIAGQARQVVEKETQTRLLLDKLSERHVRGELFEAALQQEQMLRADFEKIPKYFLEDDEQTVLAQADKESISDVHAILVGSRPVIDKLLEGAQDWENRYQEIEGRIADLKRALGEVDSLLETMPAEMIVEPYEARLKQLKTISDNLYATLSRLELESLPSILQEADRVRAATQEMGEQLKRGRRQLFALERILGELNDGLKRLSGQFAALAKNPNTPVVWNKSRGQLTDLSRHASAIGDPKKPRSPEQVEKDLAATSALLSQLKDLTRHCQMVGEKHAELLALLSSSELEDSQEFFINAQNLAAQAGGLSAENWPQADAVSTLAGDIRSLAERHERQIYHDPADTVFETEIEQEVVKIRELVGLHQTFRARLEKIRLRLLELLNVEKDTRERLQGVRNVLNQAELLARSNAYLDEVATAEIGNFRRRLEQQTEELNQRGQGLVDEKARAADLLRHQVSAAGSGWLERLNHDIEIKKKIIAEKLDLLNQIAQFDERAVDDAQRLLSEDVQSSVVQRSKGKLTVPLEEIITQLKPRSDYWQSCVAVLRALEDIEKPLLETYQFAVQQYEYVKEQLTTAAKWVADRRSWPPTTISLEAEIQEFNHIEAQWQAVESQHNRAITVVRQLSDLSSRLQTLSEKVNRAIERGEQEQNRIHDLEVELEDLSRRWHGLSLEHPEAIGEIRQIGNQINREIEDLKRQYRQGSIQYSHVLQSLKLLCQNVQNSQVPLSDGRSLRLNNSGQSNSRRY